MEERTHARVRGNHPGACGCGEQGYLSHRRSGAILTKYEVVKPLQYLHLAYVLLNLWDRGKAELEGLGLTPETAFIRFANWIGNGTSGALLADGKPVCFTGTVLGDAESYTWFQATDAFSEHVEEISRVLIEEAQQVPGDLYIYSQCIHPKTARWFSILGFDKDQEWSGTTETGKPLYRFKRR